MALTTQTWKRLATVVPAGAAIDQTLDAIYTALTAVTYYDGSARTPGSGSAWTAARYQTGTPKTEAVYCSPVVGTLNHRAIFAGSASAKTPTMASPDTWGTNVVLYGLAKNAGAYNAWDNAAPFTSGQWPGYYRLTSSTTINKVYVFECAESLCVVAESSGGVVFCCLLGALFDPYTTAALSAESDGRRYGMVNASASTGMIALQNEWAVSMLFYHQTTANTTNHSIALDVGAVATFVGLTRVASPGGATSITWLINAAGEACTVPFAVGRSAATPNDHFIGVVRQINISKNGILGQVHRSSALVDQWHYVAYLSTGSGNALGLLA